MTGETSRRLFVVKLGGSVLTRKREVERVRLKVLARLAREIAGSSGSAIILLHGAGSFGHPSAARFGLARAPSSESHATDFAQRARGAAIVSTEVRRLHGIVLATLLKAGQRPFSVPMQTHATNRSGALLSVDLEPFSTVLRNGGLPVSFGDVVPDERWGFSILSADTIAVELARRLRPESVVFVTDVEGILEAGAPGRPRVVPVIDEATVERLTPGSVAPDVTGGIRAKARAMLEIASFGVNAGLISGLKDGALSRALRGEAVYGSWSKAAIRAEV